MTPALAVDAVVLLAYFALILGIGLSQRSKSDSVEGFALGDRQTPWWAVLASILAAEISAATFLGAPESGYKNGNWTYALLPAWRGVALRVPRHALRAADATMGVGDVPCHARAGHRHAHLRERDHPRACVAALARRGG
jgi:hypothetical protein